MTVDRTHWVYEAIDADGICLYVGCTKNFKRRFKEHMAGNGDSRGWFDSFVTNWRTSGPYAAPVARSIEKQLIADRQPIFNGMSQENRETGGRGLVKQYLAHHGVRFAGTWRGPTAVVPDEDAAYSTAGVGDPPTLRRPSSTSTTQQQASRTPSRRD